MHLLQAGVCWSRTFPAAPGLIDLATARCKYQLHLCTAHSSEVGDWAPGDSLHLALKFNGSGRSSGGLCPVSGRSQIAEAERRGDTKAAKSKSGCSRGGAMVLAFYSLLLLCL